MSEQRLHILINSYCNNGCLFCSDAHKGNQTTFQILEKQAEKDLKKMRGKIKKVLFASGEPTLSKRLFYFISLAKKYGYTSIDVVTNGRKLADEKFCQKLLDAGLTEFNVSLHGSSKEVHEKITRAPNSFNETFQGLCNLSLLKKKYQFNFYVNFLLNKINLKNLESFLSLMLTFDGLDGIVLNTVLPKGRAEDFFEKIVPPYSQVAKEVRRVLGKLTPELRDRRIQVCLLGLPPCLLKGLESHIINHEQAVVRSYFRNGKSKLGMAKWEEKIQGPNCWKCSFRNACQGVWASYITKKGWNEFMPII